MKTFEPRIFSYCQSSQSIGPPRPRQGTKSHNSYSASNICRLKNAPSTNRATLDGFLRKQDYQLSFPSINMMFWGIYGCVGLVRLRSAYTIRPLVRSYGVISTCTFSPIPTQIRFLRILPETVAVTVCPFSSCTENIVFGILSKTTPEKTITSSFAMLLLYYSFGKSQIWNAGQ